MYKYLISLIIFLLSAQASAAGKDLLEPEQAFRFSARVLDASNVEVRYQIADGYYLYRERFAFAAEPGAKLGEAKIPEGKKKKDEFFGEVQTHRGELKIVVPVETAADGKVALNVTSQGCADVGVCYVPMESKIQLSLIGSAAAAGLGMPINQRFSTLPIMVLNKAKRKAAQEAKEKEQRRFDMIEALRKAKETFRFTNVAEAPVPSINRDFSAPIRVEMAASDRDRAHLMAYDPDPFARWEAGQQYATKALLDMISQVQKGKDPKPDAALIDAFGNTLRDERLERAYVAMAVVLPSEAYLADQMPQED